MARAGVASRRAAEALVAAGLERYVAGAQHAVFARLRRESPVYRQEMPDGTFYFSISRTLDKEGSGFHGPHAAHAIELGCPIQFARELVYSDGVDLDNVAAAGAPQATLTTRGGSFDSIGGSLYAGGSHDIWTGAFYVDGTTIEAVFLPIPGILTSRPTSCNATMSPLICAA